MADNLQSSQQSSKAVSHFTIIGILPNNIQLIDSALNVVVMILYRNPYGVPSSVSYQNLDDPQEMSHAEKQEIGKSNTIIEMCILFSVLNS